MQHRTHSFKFETTPEGIYKVETTRYWICSQLQHSLILNPPHHTKKTSELTRLDPLDKVDHYKDVGPSGVTIRSTAHIDQRYIYLTSKIPQLYISAEVAAVSNDTDLQGLSCFLDDQGRHAFPKTGSTFVAPRFCMVDDSNQQQRGLFPVHADVTLYKEDGTTNHTNPPELYLIREYEKTNPSVLCGCYLLQTSEFEGEMRLYKPFAPNIHANGNVCLGDLTNLIAEDDMEWDPEDSSILYQHDSTLIKAFFEPNTWNSDIHPHFHFPSCHWEMNSEGVIQSFWKNPLQLNTDFQSIINARHDAVIRDAKAFTSFNPIKENHHENSIH